MPPVFVTGGTGYLGRTLIDALLARDYPVHALVRSGAEARLPHRACPVPGDALDAETFVAAIPEQATVVHLVGTPHPSPAKAAEFRRVDLGSIRATASAARRAGTDDCGAARRGREPPDTGTRIVEVPAIRRARP